MNSAKVNKNYRITIPEEIRKVENIKVGDTVLFSIEEENKVHFLKSDREKAIKDAIGIWKDKINGSSVDYVKEIRKGWEKRLKRLGIE